ncbi:hypothetical protein ACNRWW_02035 [Metabacillus sp. HB246100]
MKIVEYGNGFAGADRAKFFFIDNRGSQVYEKIVGISNNLEPHHEQQYNIIWEDDYKVTITMMYEYDTKKLFYNFKTKEIELNF